MSKEENIIRCPYCGEQITSIYFRATDNPEEARMGAVCPCDCTQSKSNKWEFKKIINIEDIKLLDEYYAVVNGIVYLAFLFSIMPELMSENKEDVREKYKSIAEFENECVKAGYKRRPHLARFVGMTEEEMHHAINAGGEKIKKQRMLCDNQQRRSDKEDEWNPFPTHIVCVSKDIDIRTYDFVVDVLLKSDMPFEERKAFCVKNIREIKKYVKKVIKNRPYLMSKIGDLSYYYISDATVLRSAVLELIFSVKRAGDIF